jgi:hypothetical protein
MTTQAMNPALPSQERRLTGLFIAAGVALGALFVTFIILYTNFPAGYDVPPTLSFISAPLFRRLWPYPSLAISPAVFAGVAKVLIVALWAVYIAGEDVLRRCRSLATRRRVAFVTFGFALLFTAVMAVAMPPVLSSDIYLYGLFGRMTSTYHLNPYLLTASAASGDNLFPYVVWRNVTSYYGPTWVLISAATTTLAGHSVLATTIALKVVAGSFHLVNCVLVFLLARRLSGSDGLSALMLYAWNPLILIETVGSGHNDGVMMTFALAGLLLFTANRRLWGVAVLMLSVLVKYLSAVLLLLVVAAALLREKTLRAAVELAVRLGAVCALAAAALYLPFWSGPQGLAQMVAGGPPLRAVLANPLRFIMREGLARILGGAAYGLADQAAAEAYLVSTLNLLFALVLAVAVARLIAARSDWPGVIETWGVLSFVYIFFIYGGAYAWYVVSPLTIAVVGQDNRTNRLLLLASACLGIVFMLVYTMALRMIYP